MADKRISLITGGSGALGSAICLALAREGNDIAFTFHRRKAEADALADRIRNMGRRVLAGAADARSPEAVEAFCRRAEEHFGRVDVLVNNIGMIQAVPFALLEPEDWDRLMAVNLKSMFLFSKALLRGMVRRRRGVILNIGSIGGHRMLDVPVHYAASKAAVTGFTLSLAREVARYGIRVSEICPGLIDEGIGGNVPPRQMAEYSRYCAAGRPGRPGEVAEAVAFMASDRAAYINAQKIIVDGGL